MIDIYDCMVRASLKTAEKLSAGGPGSGPQGGGSDSSGGSTGGSSGGGSSGGSGSSGGGSTSPGTHKVKLPKDPSKLNISQTNKALDSMGFKLGKGSTKLVGGKFETSYEIKMPNGTSKTVSTSELKSLVYSGVSK